MKKKYIIFFIYLVIFGLMCLTSNVLAKYISNNEEIKSKIIDEYFKSEYLTCGKTRDNFIFTNCSREFVDYAKKSLIASENDEVRLCLLAISKQENDLLNKLK